MFCIYPTPSAIAQDLSHALLALIQRKPQAILGLATGSTMEPVYAAWLTAIKAQGVDITGITTFNLDEYIGLTAQHPQSYHYYMRQHLFSALEQMGLPPQQCHLPDGSIPQLELAQECAHYSAHIKKLGGLDFQLLGIGSNGHIGFNEPGTPWDSRTHVVALTERTRQDNGRFFDQPEEIPSHAITMGMADILEAKTIALVITGAHKAEVVAQLYASPPDIAMPASVLKTHSDIRVYVDEAAASALPEAVRRRCRLPNLHQAA